MTQEKLRFTQIWLLSLSISRISDISVLRANGTQMTQEKHRFAQIWLLSVSISFISVISVLNVWNTDDTYRRYPVGRKSTDIHEF